MYTDRIFLWDRIYKKIIKKYHITKKIIKLLKNDTSLKKIELFYEDFTISQHAFCEYDFFMIRNCNCAPIPALYMENTVLHF